MAEELVQSHTGHLRKLRKHKAASYAKLTYTKYDMVLTSATKSIGSTKGVNRIRMSICITNKKKKENDIDECIIIINGFQCNSHSTIQKAVAGMNASVRDLYKNYGGKKEVIEETNEAPMLHACTCITCMVQYGTKTVLLSELHIKFS